MVALKETGAHQVAQQLSDPTRFARFVRIVRAANGCVASTPEVADFFRFFRDDGIEYLPTPYPIEDENWNWAMENRSGIFVGTREFAVPTRNHLSALLAVKKLSDATKEPVTVFNFDRRRGAKLISEIGFRKIQVHEKRMEYRAYLGEVTRHKIISSSTAVVFRGKWQVMPSSAAPFVWAAMARLNGSRFRKRVGENVATPS